MQTPAAIFFDFDGVVLESLNVKADAMAKLFAHRPEHVPTIVRYHLDNAGVSRYDKFRYYYREFFNEPLSDQEMARLDRDFGRFAWEGLLRAPFVLGAREFLERWYSEFPLYVTSAAPQGELEQVVRERGLLPFFRSVHGSPKKKAEHVRELLAAHSLDPGRCLFIGDARADMEAAAANSVPFVQRLTSITPEPFSPPPVAAIKDLHAFDLLWRSPRPKRPARIASSSENPERLAQDRPFRWIYLGKDYLGLRTWQKKLGPGAELLPISAHVQRVAQALKRPFLAYLETLGRAHGSLEWWSSKIAEENTLSGSLFTDLCSLTVAKDLLEHESPLDLIVSESPGILDTLEADGLGRRSDALGPFKDRLRYGILFAGRWTLYALRAARTSWVAWRTRSRPLTPDSRPIALLHTCITEGYFGKEGPRDAYLSVLPEALERNGFRVMVLSWIYSLERPMADAFRWLRSQTPAHIIPEDLTTWADRLWAAGVLWRQGRLPPLPQLFCGSDISPLLAHHRRMQRANTSAVPFILHTRVLERLCGRGLSPAVYIDLWENSLTEKPAVLALRRCSPRTRTIGFQHFLSIPPLYLEAFSGARIPEIVPFPDRIVCSSAFTRDTLLAAGFPAERLAVGPSLRHRSLLSIPLSRREEPRTVLVGLSIEKGAALELLSMLADAFPEPAGLTLWVKPHPNMPEEQWREILQERPLSPGMQVIAGRIEEWALRASCAVSMASTACMDLALCGAPVVAVARATVVDFNPLAHFPEFPPPVRSAPDLRREVLRLVGMGAPEREGFRRWADWARRTCLSPIDESTLSVFTKVPAQEERCAV